MSACFVNEEINIVELIERENITTLFHPIVSVNKKAIVGFEALSRGLHPQTEEMIAPLHLFDCAGREGVQLELDRLCRRKAFENFQRFYHYSSDWFLTVNIDTSILDMGTVGSGNLLNSVNLFNLNPNNIVIEIVESKIDNLECLKTFVELYRDYGFLIALDDFGAGHSNFERVSIIKPDVLKVDRSIVKYIDQEYYKQEILKSLVNLAHKLGTLVIAEGIEREEEALTALELGVDLLQGFYFSQPDRFSRFVEDPFDQKIDFLVRRYKQERIAKLQGLHSKRKDYEAIVQGVISQLVTVEEEAFDAALTICLKGDENIECLYILNQDGIQISRTILNYDKLPEQKQVIFQPAPKGADLSMKDYYLLHSTGLRLFITDPYISGASGNMCRTISVTFSNHREIKFVLCVDVKL